MDDEAARRSLALKLAMIERARHTIDIAYYLFKRDRVGYAFIGALHLEWMIQLVFIQNTHG